MKPSNSGLAVQDEEIVETLIRMLICSGLHLKRIRTAFNAISGQD
jgi:hypothetical protein